ncbi:MAG: FtsQ-type POTRA domain-containing protein [Candidatus Solibacter usitatus]|nr:FtsQ-type POTRA domain-containing protein [Candidatus Solibacter usitatus]
MARRSRQQSDEELDQARSEERAAAGRSIRKAMRFTGWTIGSVAVVFAIAWSLMEGERFFSTDPRFQLPREGATARDGAITVRGLKNASRAAVLQVFAADRGRGLLDINLEQRRTQIRRIDWVRDAGVRRVWPDRLEVDVHERQPVAFIQVAAGMTGNFNNPVTFKPMLVDADGVILRMRGPMPQDLPLLMGIRESDDIEKRRSRVLAMLRLLDELKEHRDRIPEVDVSDSESLRITYQTQDQQVILILGNERFLERLNIFLRHYDGIRERLPQRAILDVSLEGRITAIGPLESAAR